MKPIDIMRMSLCGTEEFVLATDYAALEAENAELKKERDEYGLAVHHEQYNMENEIDSLKSELATANATLDALRDLFAPDKVISNSTCMKAVDILYPTPETPND